MYKIKRKRYIYQITCSDPMMFLTFFIVHRKRKAEEEELEKERESMEKEWKKNFEVSLFI